MERHIIEHLNQARRSLDFLNWDVANFRAEHGMSSDLVKLYSAMEPLDREILRAISTAARCYDMFTNMYKELKND